LCIYFLLILFKFWVWIRKRGGPNNVVWGYVSCRRRCFMDNFRLARQNRRTVSSLDAIYSSTTDGRGNSLFIFLGAGQQHLRAVSQTNKLRREKKKLILLCLFVWLCVCRHNRDIIIITHKVTLWHWSIRRHQHTHTHL
jgi:hypothetical protein